jgi:hypothetical protein
MGKPLSAEWSWGLLVGLLAGFAVAMIAVDTAAQAAPGLLAPGSRAPMWAAVVAWPWRRSPCWPATARAAAKRHRRPATDLDRGCDLCDNYHIMAAVPPAPISDLLRRTIAGSNVPYQRLERETGVQRASIMRFVRGTQSLRLDKADRLAAYFGLELRPAHRRKGT